MSLMKVYVISTVSRGIGLEMAKQLLSLSSPSVPVHVIGLCRNNNNERNIKLNELIDSYPNNLSLVSVDLSNEETIHAACNQIKANYTYVDGLFNVAGVLGDGINDDGPERSINSITSSWMKKSFEINTIGHVLLTRELFPLLKRDKKQTNEISKVVNISARVGSISDNHLGGWYSYRMSKAALNMFTKTFSIEAKKHSCVVFSCHPGTTDTDLSKPFQRNVKPEKLFSVEYSVSKILNLFNSITTQDCGKFYAYDGIEIPY
eukprot:gene17208-23709_t